MSEQDSPKTKPPTHLCARCSQPQMRHNFKHPFEPRCALSFDARKRDPDHCADCLSVSVRLAQGKAEVTDPSPPRNLPGALQPWTPGEVRWNTYRYETHTGDANGEVHRTDIKVLEQKWTRAGISEWHEVPAEPNVKVMTS